MKALKRNEMRSNFHIHFGQSNLRLVLLLIVLLACCSAIGVLGQNCFGLNSTQSLVCSGFGSCTAQDTCTCVPGASGSTCGKGTVAGTPKTFGATGRYGPRGGIVDSSTFDFYYCEYGSLAKLGWNSEKYAPGVNGAMGCLSLAGTPTLFFVAIMGSTQYSIFRSTGTFSGGGSLVPNVITSQYFSGAIGSMFYSASNDALYISDITNHIILKATGVSTGTSISATIIAGSYAKFGYKDGDALSALLNMPNDIFVNSNSEVIFSDSGNNVIRKIGTDGQISTVYGNIAAGQSALNHPTGFAFYNNNLYVVEKGSKSIKKIDSYGKMSPPIYSTTTMDSEFSRIYFTNGTTLMMIDHDVNQIKKMTISEGCLDSRLSGAECTTLATCQSIAFTDPAVCSGNGVCTATNVCKCKDGFFGSNCQEFKCFGVNSTNPMACNGKGVCVNGNTCNCASGDGLACQYDRCFGLRADNADVCSGNGVCKSTDSCSCHEGYFGLKCELTKGIPYYTMARTNIASTSNHICSDGQSIYYIDSKATTMNLKKWDLTTGLNSSIATVSMSISQIQVYNGLVYYLESSMIKFINGSTSTAYMTSGTMGTLPSGITSISISGFHIGKFGVILIDRNSNLIFRVVEHPITKARENSLIAGKSGAKVNPIVFSNGNGLSTDISNSQLGQVFVNDFGDVYFSDIGFGVIRKFNLFDKLISTVAGIPNTRGYITNNSPAKLSPINMASLSNILEHNGGILFFDTMNYIIRKVYRGNLVNIAGTPKIIKTSTVGLDSLESSIYSTTGVLTKVNGDIYFVEPDGLKFLKLGYRCADGFSGENCLDVLTCNNVAFTDSSVCSGNGKCKSSGCECNYSWSGNNCEIPTCFDVSGSNPKVCSGRGNCTSTDKCACTSSSGYNGDKCSEFSCFGVPRNSKEVCGGKGTCTSPDTCLCFNSLKDGFWSGSTCNSCVSPYTGSNCDAIPQTNQCEDAITCLGNGKCVNGKCSCNGNYNGTNCNTCKDNYFGPLCDVYCTKLQCSNNGICESRLNGQCSCYSDSQSGFFSGSSCNVCQDGYFGSKCASKVVGPAVLSDMGNSLTFKMFGPTSWTKQSIPCHKIIKISTSYGSSSVFGLNPKCYWTSKESGDFVIEFGDNYNVKPDSTVLSVRQDSFDLVSNINTPTIDLRIAAPTNPIKPIAKIQKRKTEFGSCENLVLDGSASFSGDRKPLIFHWSLVYSTSSSVDEFSAILSNVTDSRVIVPTLSFPAGTHNLQLIVESTLFGTSSEPDTFEITKGTLALPIVSIVGKNPLVITKNTVPVIIKKSVVLPSCVPNDTALVYNWNLVSGGSSSPPTYLVDSLSNLVITSFNLIGLQNYVFEVSAQFSFGGNVSKSSALVTITTTPQPLSLTSLLIGLSYESAITEFVLTDPDMSSSPETWVFTCSSSNGPCGSGVDTLLSNVASSREPKITIQRSIVSAAVLSGFGKIVIGLNVTKDLRSVYSQALISFPLTSTSIPPAVSPLNNPPLRINPTDGFFSSMKATINGAVNRDISSKWLVDGNYAGFTSYIYYNNFEEGKSYNFVYTATYQGVSADFSQTVVVNRVPSCSCSVLPDTGFALDTQFVMSCPNCQNQEQTYEISFGFVDGYTGAEVTLYNQGENMFTSALPPQPRSLTKLFIKIKDKTTSAQILKSFMITVANPVALSLAEISDKLDNWNFISTYLPEGDPGKLIYNSVSISNAVKYMLSILDPNANTNTRSIKSLRSVECYGHGSIVNGVCKCDAGYHTSDCRYNSEDFAVIQKFKGKLFKDFEKTQRARNSSLEVISEDIMTIAVMGLDSFLSDFDYLSQYTMNSSMLMLDQILEEAMSRSELAISGNLGDSYMQIVETIYKFSQLDGSVKSIKKQLEIFSNKISSLCMRSRIVGVQLRFNSTFENVVSNQHYPDDLDGLSFTYNNDDQSQFPGVSVKLPQSLSQIMNAPDRTPVSHKMKVISDLDDLKIKIEGIRNESGIIRNDTIISSYMLDWRFDSYTLSNLTDRIIYQLPLSRPANKKRKTRALVQEYEYSCQYIDTNGTVKQDSTCTISFVDDNTAQCQCTEQTSVVVVESIKLSSVSDYVCGNIQSSDPTVCNGHGICTNNEVCVCNAGYNGSYCENTLSNSTNDNISNNSTQDSNNGTTSNSTNSSTTNTTDNANSNSTSNSNTTNNSNTTDSSNNSTNSSSSTNTTDSSSSNSTNNNNGFNNNTTTNSTTNNSNNSTSNTTDSTNTSNSTENGSNTTNSSNSTNNSNSTNPTENTTSNSTTNSNTTNNSNTTDSSNNSSNSSTNTTDSSSSNSTNNNNNGFNNNTTNNSTTNTTNNSNSTNNSNNETSTTIDLTIQADKEVVEYCDSIKLQAILSNNHGSTILYKWFIISSPISNSYLESAVKSVENTIQLDSSKLISGMYIVGLNVTASNQIVSKSVTFKVNEFVPELTLKEGSSISAPYTSTAYVTPIVKLPKCYQEADSISYKYEMNPNQPSVADISKFFTQNNHGILMIGKDSTVLPKQGDYYFKLTVKANNGKAVSTLFKVTSIAEPLTVSFNITDSSQSIDESLSFSVLTRDPNSLNENEVLEITCLDDKNVECKNIKYPITSTYSTSLSAGIFKFTAKFTKGTRFASTMLTITVLDLPKSSFIKSNIVLSSSGSESLDLNNINPNYDLIFTFETKESLVNPTYLWSSQILSNMNRNETNSYIILSKNVVSTLEKDAYHQVSLTMNDGIKFSKSSISFKVNSPPTIGSLTSTPSTGTAMETLFELKAENGWNDENAPLSYKFFYYDGSVSIWKPLGERSLINSLSTMLPLSYSPENPGLLRIKVVVYDSMLIFSETETSVLISKPTVISDSVLTSLIQTSAETVSSSLVSTALDVISSVSSSSNNSELLKQATNNLVSTFVESLTNKNTTVTTESAISTISAFSSVGSCLNYIQDSTTSNVISMLSSLTQNVADSLKIDSQYLTVIKSTADKLYAHVESSITSRSILKFSDSDLKSVESIYTNLAKAYLKGSVPDMPPVLISTKSLSTYSRRVNVVSLKKGLISHESIDGKNSITILNELTNQLLSLQSVTILAKSQPNSKTSPNTDLVSDIIDISLYEASQVSSTSPIASLEFKVIEGVESYECLTLNTLTSKYEKSDACVVKTPNARDTMVTTIEASVLTTGSFVIAKSTIGDTIITPIENSNLKLLGLLALLALVVLVVVVLLVVCICCCKRRKKKALNKERV